MEQVTQTATHPWIRRISIGILLLLIGGGIWIMSSGYDWKAIFDEAGPHTPVIYVAALTLLPLAAFPISAFYIASGLLFDPMTAIGLTAFGLTLNMTLGYWLSRSVLKYPLQHYTARARINPRWLEASSLVKLTLLIRGVPGVPYFLQNMILGVARVPFGAYLVLSVLIQTLYCAGMVFLTHSGTKFRSAPEALWFALAGITIFVILLVLAKKLKAAPSSGIDSTHP